MIIRRRLQELRVSRIIMLTAIALLLAGPVALGQEPAPAAAQDAAQAPGKSGLFTTETGALHPMVWVLALMIAAFSIVLVFLIMYFIVPMKNSPGKYFVKAKREKKPVIFLDAGKFWRCVVCEQKVGEEKAQIFRNGQDIIKGGQGMKYCEGVLVGVAEDFRSLLVNIGLIDLMDGINKKKWEPTELEDKLKIITENLKRDLGFTDDIKTLEEKLTADVVDIRADYDAKREKIILEHTVEPKKEHGADAAAEGDGSE